ncbi:MAG: aldo/keto reductase [Gemmatimonadaceae bacterium]
MKRFPPPPEHRALGRTGGVTSILGLGTRQLAESGQQATIRVIREAIDHGVNVLEISPGFAGGRAERWVGLALRDGYRAKVQLVWQCAAYQRDYKTSMLQLEATLSQLKTDRVDLWSFHQVIYDNDPDWMYDHGGLDAAQEARDQGKARWIAFHGEKAPHIALKLLARGFAWDAVLMPLNPFDGSYRSFEKQVLSEVIRRGGAVIGTKPLAGGSVPTSKVVKVEDAFRYVWSLPVSTVLVGCPALPLLKKALRQATNFKPFHPGEMDAVRQKARAMAGDGRFERYKTTQAFDSAAGRAAHGF